MKEDQKEAVTDEPQSSPTPNTVGGEEVAPNEPGSVGGPYEAPGTKVEEEEGSDEDVSPGLV